MFSIALSNVRTTRNVKRREKGKGILIMLSCIFFSLGWFLSHFRFSAVCFTMSGLMLMHTCAVPDRKRGLPQSWTPQFNSLAVNGRQYETTSLGG
jgi:hypothetical protein